MSNFWVPPTKAALLKWFKDQGVVVNGKEPKKQLYAIYFSVRNRKG